MGQYYKIVNLDKEQYIHPWDFGDGAKLMEFGNSRNGTLLGLAILLADGNNRGGGDFRSDDPLVGSWAGDRIVIAGDYADPNSDFLNHADLGDNERNLYQIAADRYENISQAVVDVIDIAGEFSPERRKLIKSLD